MDRPADLSIPPDSSQPPNGLGPVGDWLGGEWPARAAEQVESAVNNIRRKTTGPAIVASRALVYGLVAIVFVGIAGMMLLIAVLRSLDALMPTWAVELLVGLVLCVAGLACWNRRTGKEIVS